MRVTAAGSVMMAVSGTRERFPVSAHVLSGPVRRTWVGGSRVERAVRLNLGR